VWTAAKFGSHHIEFTQELVQLVTVDDIWADQRDNGGSRTHPHHPIATSLDELILDHTAEASGTHTAEASGTRMRMRTSNR
jgi:hypothetical protein